MNVSREKVLQKMEQEIVSARRAAPEEAERHIYAIKSMCDLLMGMETAAPASKAAPAPAVMAPQVQQLVQTVGQAERISTEDGSNGDSIFDF